MNWHDILPADIAKRQIAYDRVYRAWRMRQCGFTFGEIGLKLGVNYSRARELYCKYERGRPPVKVYLNSWSDVLQLHQQMKKIP